MGIHKDASAAVDESYHCPTTRNSKCYVCVWFIGVLYQTSKAICYYFVTVPNSLVWRYRSTGNWLKLVRLSVILIYHMCGFSQTFQQQFLKSV